jgi:hypothetical protein
MKSTRDIGNELEEIIANKIRVIEPNCRRTKNSGANTELEDLNSQYFLVQCKVDTKKENIIIKIKDWNKLMRKLPIQSKRIPIFANKQKDGIITITLGLDDYFRLIYKCFENNGGI